MTTTLQDSKRLLKIKKTVYKNTSRRNDICVNVCKRMEIYLTFLKITLQNCTCCFRISFITNWLNVCIPYINDNSTNNAVRRKMSTTRQTSSGTSQYRLPLLTEFFHTN